MPVRIWSNCAGPTLAMREVDERKIETRETCDGPALRLVKLLLMPNADSLIVLRRKCIIVRKLEKLRPQFTRRPSGRFLRRRACRVRIVDVVADRELARSVCSQSILTEPVSSRRLPSFDRKIPVVRIGQSVSVGNVNGAVGSGIVATTGPDPSCHRVSKCLREDKVVKSCPRVCRTPS